MAAEPTRAENDAADRALAQWLAKAPKEATLEPALEIVDPHHHLWIDALHGGPRRYLIDEIMADMNSGHNVVGTVFVDCFSMYTEGVTDGSHTVGETTFAQGMFAMSDSGAWGKTRVCQGIISRVDLSLGAQKVEQYLRAHMAAGRNFRGIRSFDFAPWPATEAEKEPLADAVFVEGLEVVNKLGLVLEVYAGHSLDTGFARIAQLADKFPELTIVLNHCGAMAGPALLSTPALVDQWKAGITAVAAAGNQNIVCKLGGIQMAMNGFGFDMAAGRTRPPSSEEMAEATLPYYEHCIRAFGAHRCMFESNFPVDNDSCSYHTLWNSFKRIAATLQLSDSEKKQVFAGTAKRAYSLDFSLPRL